MCLNVHLMHHNSVSASVCVYMCKLIVVCSAYLGACVVMLNLFIFSQMCIILYS